jgi:hypothetical protein
MIVRHATLPLLIAALLMACGRSHEAADTMPGGAANPSTTTDAGEPTEPSEPPLTPPSERELTAEETAWANASDFEIGLQGTPCYGTCPSYEMTLRADGSLHFVGYEFVVLPGTYDVQRSAADAARLYSNIILRGFLGLQAKYESEADGCPEVWTDNPTTYYTLKANGREKKVHYYEAVRANCRRSTRCATSSERSSKSRTSSSFSGAAPIGGVRGFVSKGPRILQRATSCVMRRVKP